jgi:hypothetical protein
MPRLSLALIAAALACAAGASRAQSNPAAATPPDAGFFRPQPGDDPSLFRTLPPEAYAPQAPASTAATASRDARNAPTPTTVVVVPTPYVPAPAEDQLDRAQIEAQRAQAALARQPAPINGAFTGLTDERDR